MGTNAIADGVTSGIPAPSDEKNFALRPWHKGKNHPIAMTFAEKSLVYPGFSSRGRPSAEEWAVKPSIFRAG